MKEHVASVIRMIFDKYFGTTVMNTDWLLLLLLDGTINYNAKLMHILKKP